jgi:hypothetical protein
VAFPIAPGYDYRLLTINPTASYNALHRRCGDIRDEQLHTAQRLKGDHKYWFAKVYHFVTKFSLEDMRSGVYQYPHMKMQQIALFHETYARNLAAWEAGNRGDVEANWKRAFAAADDAESVLLGASRTVGNALQASMEAHIRFDLPRAIAAAYTTHYEGIPGASIARFRGDFFAMGSVFERAQVALNGEIDDAGTDFWPFNWEGLGEAVFPFFFHVGLEREMAWEKAEIIARSARLGAPALERTLRAAMGARHPNLSPFDVEGDNVRGYGWMSQPGLRSDAPGLHPLQRPAPSPPFLSLTLYFRLDRPRGGEPLEDVVRPGQDLQPLVDLAEWSRGVRDSVILLSGHASSEGTEVGNRNLALARAQLVEFFLWRASADLDHNNPVTLNLAEAGAEATAAWRKVVITVIPGVSKEQVLPSNRTLPSEASPSR